ncbi:MAG: hypothetical protein JRF33_00995 [Deltaproteobacteria bacterium]|nr:hypothetical protein [Deltaproteobacteria bacterium]
MTERLVCLRVPDLALAALPSTQTAIENLGRRFSPRVRILAGGELCLALAPNQGRPEQVLHAAERAGFSLCLGVAQGPTLAWLASKTAGAGEVREVPLGRERGFLAPLSLDLLEGSGWLDSALRASLRRFGIEGLGQLAALPARGLERRLGPAGLRLWRLARGEDREAFVGQKLAERLSEECEADWAVDRLPALETLWLPLLERLVDRLGFRGLNAQALDVRLGLAGGGLDQRRIALANPSRRVSIFRDLLRRELERRPPSAPVESLRIEAESEPVRVLQADLFASGPPPSRRLDETLAALQALSGELRVGRVKPCDGHHPDAFEIEGFAHRYTSSPPAFSPPSVDPSVSLRALRPPRPVQVRIDDRARRPLQLRGDGLHGRVRRAVGPFRLDAAWWTATPLKRDYYDVELEGGGLFRLYREGGTGAWFVDGILG